MTGPFAVDPRQPTPTPRAPGERPGRPWVLLWLPGLAVALGSAVATAHGLFEVAVAARVPGGIAWIYPLITDGLALVAYTATARLHGSGARYAWSVVVLAAGLSGLAQAVYLATDPAPGGAAGGAAGGVVALAIDPALRFGVGAWPAVAAAIVAHLLYLLAVEPRDATPAVPAAQPGVQPVASVQPVQPSSGPDRRADAVGAAEQVPALPGGPVSSDAERARVQASAGAAPAVVSGADDGGRGGESPVRDRARAAAARHAARHGALPTVRELMALAEVSRGSAAAALQQLRDQPTALHLVRKNADSPDTSETSTQR